MKRIHEIRVEYCENIPGEPAQGVLYVSKQFEIAVHLRACGCDRKTITPQNEWKLTEKDGKVALRPSIGNWAGESLYHAHYYITNNKIDWLCKILLRWGMPNARSLNNVTNTDRTS